MAQSLIDSVSPYFTLKDCVDYALKNQPALQQAKLDEQITRKDVNIALSEWLPKLNLNADLQHYLKLPVIFFPNSADPGGPKIQTTSGLVNSSALRFSVTQNIYKTELFFAKKTSSELYKLSEQNTENAKIELVVNVSKAFYDVLLSQQQMKVIEEDILRLNKNLNDAYALYKNGLTEKTDYQRSTIAINNALTEKRSTEEAIKVKIAYLKQIIGMPLEKPMSVRFDSALVNNELIIDTMQTINYERRIEFRTLQTGINLQKFREKYYKWTFLPDLSAFADYNYIFQNDRFSSLYSRSFPNSYIGLSLNFPIFQGNIRLLNLKKANLQNSKLMLDLINLKNQINTEYVQALGSYKRNLEQLYFARENIKLARDIFKTVKLQYDNGIVMYLEVIVAETDLRTAQFNYLNSLYTALTSVLDVRKALGDIEIK